ncbi:hypothetical protein D3C80_1612820 [compost metagenome]
MPFHGQVVAGVFQRNAAPQRILGALHVVADADQGLVAAGKRQQVGEVLPAPARPCQVLRYQRRLQLVDQRPQAVQVHFVWRDVRRQRQRDTVQRQRMVFGNAL